MTKIGEFSPFLKASLGCRQGSVVFVAENLAKNSPFLKKLGSIRRMRHGKNVPKFLTNCRLYAQINVAAMLGDFAPWSYYE